MFKQHDHTTVLSLRGGSDLYLNQRGRNHTRLHSWRFDCFCFSSRWISSGTERRRVTAEPSRHLIIQTYDDFTMFYSSGAAGTEPPHHHHHHHPACHQRVIKVCLSFSWSVFGSTPNTNSCPLLYVVSSLSCLPPPVCLYF